MKKSILVLLCFACSATFAFDHDRDINKTSFQKCGGNQILKAQNAAVEFACRVFDCTSIDLEITLGCLQRTNQFYFVMLDVQNYFSTGSKLRIRYNIRLNKIDLSCEEKYSPDSTECRDIL